MRASRAGGRAHQILDARAASREPSVAHCDSLRVTVATLSGEPRRHIGQMPYPPRPGRHIFQHGVGYWAIETVSVSTSLNTPPDLVCIATSTSTTFGDGVLASTSWYW
jgi:hypothetical protein